MDENEQSRINELNRQIEETTAEENEQRENQGFIEKVKSKLSTAKHKREYKQVLKDEAENDRLNQQLEDETAKSDRIIERERVKSEIAEKRAEISKMVKERRQNSPMERIITKVKTAITSQKPQSQTNPQTFRPFGANPLQEFSMQNHDHPIHNRNNFNARANPLSEFSSKGGLNTNLLSEFAPKYKRQGRQSSNFTSGLNVGLLSEFASKYKRGKSRQKKQKYQSGGIPFKW